MKNQIVHWNTHTWNQKLASCSKSAIVIDCYRSHLENKLIKQFTAIKCYNSPNFIVEVLKEPALPLPPSTTPILTPAFQMTASPGDIRPARLNLCPCERIRANCYIMPPCSLRDGDVWKALSGKRWFDFPPARLKGHKKTKFFPMKLQMLPLDLTQW